MPAHHVEQQYIEHCQLEGEVKPWHLKEQGCKQGYGAPVEREDIGIFHQRQTLAAERIAEALRYVAVRKTAAQFGTQCLHAA